MILVKSATVSRIPYPTLRIGEAGSEIGVTVVVNKAGVLPG